MVRAQAKQTVSNARSCAHLSYRFSHFCHTVHFFAVAATLFLSPFCPALTYAPCTVPA